MSQLVKKMNLQNSKVVKKLGLQKVIALFVLVLIYAFFAMSSPAFRSMNTLVSIFDASYYVGFLAIGVTFVIITGGIDLSIGTVMMCSALIGGIAYNEFGIPFWLTMIIMILVGMFFGLLNGLMVAKLKLPAFIATLGTMMVTTGLGSIVSNVRSVSFPLRSAESGWFRSIFRTADNFPIGIFVLVILGIAAAIVLNKTKLGRYIFAIGSNIEATRLSGVNVVKWQTWAYIISGMFAGIAAISYAAIYTTILPGSGGGMELDAIAAVVVGGTSLAGGVGSILGTFIGVYIMTILQIGLPFINLQPHYQTFITGFVVILAVYADIYRNKKQGGR